MNDLAPAAPQPGGGGRTGRLGAPEATGVQVRPAATVMLVRDAVVAGGGDERGLEVLMLRRNPGSVFAAGAWVFPGGALDSADGSLRCVSYGPTDAEASVTLGIASGGLAFWVAAARECFEEAGILLARHARSGDWLDISAELDAARFARYRRDVHSGRRLLSDVLAVEGLVLDVGDVRYVSHWITPPGAPRRFDTRFFVAAAPPGQVASHDASETVESVWTTPARVLERQAAGDIHLVFPTIKNLEALSRFRSVAELLDAARSMGPVPRVAPRFRGDPEIASSALHPEPPCPT